MFARVDNGPNENEDVGTVCPELPQVGETRRYSGYSG